MSEWILVLVLLGPSGDFKNKIPVPQPTRAACESTMKEMRWRTDLNTDDVKVKPWVCVSKSHWEGKTVDKGVPLD